MRGLKCLHFLNQKNCLDQAASGSSQMRGNLALDQAACYCLVVDGPCRLESPVVVLVLHINFFSFFERARREASSGLSDTSYGGER